MSSSTATAAEPVNESAPDSRQGHSGSPSQEPFDGYADGFTDGMMSGYGEDEAPGLSGDYFDFSMPW